MDRVPLLFLVLVVGVGVFYVLGGFVLALSFFLIWLHRHLTQFAKLPDLLGIETSTLGIALAGIFYGPIVGFLFGMVGSSVLRSIRMRIAMYGDEPFPYVPSTGDVLDGFGGVVAALLGPLGVVLAVFLTVIIKNGMEYAKHLVTSGPGEFFWTIYIIPNILFTTWLAAALPLPKPV